MGLDSVEDILDFAIKSEERASEFYTRLAEKVKRGNMTDQRQSFLPAPLPHEIMLP